MLLLDESVKEPFFGDHLVLELASPMDSDILMGPEVSRPSSVDGRIVVLSESLLADAKPGKSHTKFQCKAARDGGNSSLIGASAPQSSGTFFATKTTTTK